MKKIGVLILALILVCSISASAFAATPKAYGFGDTTIGDALDGLIGGIFNPEPGPFDNFLEDFLKTVNPNGGSFGEMVGNIVVRIFG